MFIKEVLKLSFQKLKNISTTPDLDSEILLSHVLKNDRAFLLANLDKKITSSHYKTFQKLITRRAKHEPIAYITNNKEFYGLNFYVNHDVLIPRPETELIVENVINVVNNRSQRAKQSNVLNICDVGTGSGCIAIALAKNIPQAKIYAADISKKALDVAKFNAKRHKVLSKIKFYNGNLLEPIPKKIKFNIIIANLPYLSEKQYINIVEDRHACPLQYEPKSALIAKNHGMEFYIKLLKQVPKYIKKEGYILLEIDPSFENKIIFETINILKIKRNQINIKPDLQGLSRVLTINI